MSDIDNDYASHILCEPEFFTAGKMDGPRWGGAVIRAGDVWASFQAAPEMTSPLEHYIDERWTPRLIQFFEELMQAYTKAGNLGAALHDHGRYDLGAEPGAVAQAGRESARQVRLYRTRPVASAGRPASGHA